MDYNSEHKINILESISNLRNFFKRLYLFIHETERERERERERQRHRQREKQAPRRVPDMGFNPRYPGSNPGLKVVLNR